MRDNEYYMFTVELQSGEVERYALKRVNSEGEEVNQIEAGAYLIDKLKADGNSEAIITGISKAYLYDKELLKK